ncbi:hypothetical protein GCM10027280_41900 [Micromonospora polyrhachis]|uniref:GerMN domain-containing protein n=1 Tax=Micromonospora polyrhachis TaxID=1282883 RepID=A0A7W7SLQ6_9ACTN|nr:GerMN domain-containing protein [Micromonospora polyrhachis]MBB4957113.1 hypothetical protein [Micromonospora polyrhachis]
MKHRIGLAGVLTAAVLYALVGCGVPDEDTPRRVTPPRDILPATGTPATAPTQAGTVVERLYYVRDDRLVPVDRRLWTAPSAAAHLELLLAGPNNEEQDAGLSSALTGADPIVGLRIVGNEAIIDVGDSLAGAGRTDEILAFGQIVATLTTRPDIDRVTFRHNGDGLGIPRADGSLSRTPLTAGDYAALTSTD